MSGYIVIGNAAFSVDKPLGGSGRVIHFDDVPGIERRLKGFLQESLNIGFVDPGRAQPHVDFRRFQRFGQGLTQRFRIDGKVSVRQCGRFGSSEFFPDVAGEIFVRRHITEMPFTVFRIRQWEDNALQFVCKLFR